MGSNRISCPGLPESSHFACRSCRSWVPGPVLGGTYRHGPPWMGCSLQPLPYAGLSHRPGSSDVCSLPPSRPQGLRGLQGESGTPSPSASLLPPTGCLNCSKVSELTERLKVLEAKVGKQLPPCPQPPYPLPAPRPAHSAFPQHPWAGNFPVGHSPSSCGFSPQLFWPAHPRKPTHGQTAWPALPPGGP